VLPRSGRLELAQRLDVQMVFQDALASLDPSISVGGSVALAVRQRRPSWGVPEVQARVIGLLQACGLDPALAHRYPGELSGGQNQRAAIARALGAEPLVLACDEAVSSLDVTVRNQVLDLLDRLKRESGLAILFVTHDMAVVRRLCDQVIVLHKGRVVESGDARQVLLEPRHPYTRTLLDAVLEMPALDRA
jgi:peptide/nickel transport system ATP-binding protein